MDVKELSKDQLEELRFAYFYTYDSDNHYFGMEFPDGYQSIPDKIIFDYYEGIYFVNDDFSCTAGIN